MRIPFIALVMLGACGAGLAYEAQAADVYVISSEAVRFAPGELREVSVISQFDGLMITFGDGSHRGSNTYDNSPRREASNLILVKFPG